MDLLISLNLKYSEHMTGIVVWLCRCGLRYGYGMVNVDYRRLQYCETIMNRLLL
jgi:hypothetical protein